jgi:endonuclease YncB( thermonuclease family)
MSRFEERPATRRRPRRFWPPMLVGVVFILALTAAVIWDGPARGTDRYIVRDGDTLEWTPRNCLLSRFGLSCLSQPLRLYGVDAFESAQTCRDAAGRTWPCGAVATRRLAELAARQGFICDVDSEFIDKRAREFAVCTVDGKDVGGVLVSEGLAFYYGRGLQYLPIEAEARREKRGAWAGRFVRPQFWRQGARS